MDVDEAGRDSTPARVDLDRSALDESLTDGEDPAVRDCDVELAAGIAKSVEDGAVPNDEVDADARAKDQCRRAAEHGGGRRAKKVSTCGHGWRKRCERLPLAPRS